MSAAVDLFDTDLPVVGAPLAGGPSTVALAAAVADAGGFAFLAGGYKTPDVLAEQIRALREQHEQFGVNVFVPAPERIDPAALAAYAKQLQPEFDRYDLVPDPRPVSDDDHWGDKILLLRENPVPVVSFTFGLPSPADIAGLKRAGTRVLATVTTAAEARAAADAGIDALVVQGPAAGGHSAAFDPRQVIALTPTSDVVRTIAAAVPLPIVATGGVDGPDAVRNLLGAGAQAVAVGTLLLRTHESGASATHKDALANPRFTTTALTRAFTGRTARGLRNDFIDAHPHAPLGYPELHHLTRPLRQAAARAADPERLHLWAGTGYRAAVTAPAADVIAHLSATL
jgi:nitronate monooxygenase